MTFPILKSLQREELKNSSHNEKNTDWQLCKANNYMNNGYQMLVKPVMF